MKKTKLSVFDIFCILDVNNRGGITLLELKTGLQKLGIKVFENEL
jgi:Ca2+-binding EF-hand superfamily protein